MFNLDNLWIEIYCPKCKYQFEIQMIDARLETTVYCHNCKCSIQLKDEEASIHNATQILDDINQKFNSFFN